MTSPGSLGLNGRAHVYLVDKEYFLVTRIVDLFLVEPSYAAGTRLTEGQRPAALTLYRARRAGGPGWSVFLATFVDLVRTKRRHQPERGVVERFFHARDALAAAELGAQAERVLEALSRTRVWAVLTRLAHDDRSIPPPLEPMLPALAETHKAGTPPARLSPLAGLVTVDSRDDPRVQVADLLAGIARRSPNIGKGGLLQPFLSVTSLRDPGP